MNIRINLQNTDKQLANVSLNSKKRFLMTTFNIKNMIWKKSFYFPLSEFTLE